MDTKSKSFKYSYFTKTVALILSFTLVFAVGYSAFSLFRSEIIFEDGNEDSFIATPSFLYNIRKDLNIIAAYSTFDMSLTKSKEVFVEKEPCTKISVENLYADRETAIQLFDMIQEFKKRMPKKASDEENGNEQDDYNENYDSYTTTMYNFNMDAVFTTPESYPVSTTKFSPYDFLYYYSPSQLDVGKLNSFINRSYDSYDEWNADYQALRGFIFSLVNNASSHATINEEFDKKIDKFIEDNLNSYINRYNYYQALVLGMTNLRFVVINQKTKEVFSNTDENINDFISSLSDGLFHIEHSAKDGLISGGIPERTESTEAIIEFFTSSFGSYDRDLLNNNLEDYFGTDYNVYIKMPAELKRGDVYHYIYQNYNSIKAKGDTFNVPLILFLALFSIFPMLYLVIVAGRKDEETVTLAPTDKIPFLLHFTLSIGIAAGLIVLIAVLVGFEFDNTYYESALYTLLSMVYTSVPVVVGILLGSAYLVLLELFLSISRLVKTKSLHRYTLTYHIVKLLKNFFKILAFPFSKNLKRKLVWGIIFFLLTDALLAFLVGAIQNEGLIVAFFLWMPLNAAALFVTIRLISGLTDIAKTAEEMKSGNYDVPLDINSLPKSLRKAAEDIIDIRGSIKTAVNEQLKSDRMKTELITNVSHDLKTPLTSIINYVDLLKKCNIEDEECKRHLEVLDEKSKRLKNLIEDLTEASKASTGNIKINRVPIDLSELAVQALGEHSDAFEVTGLDIVYEAPKEHPIVYADSQHTWRIIENLISNVKKYAQPETRVYMEVYTDYDYGVFSIKNVSRNPLNIPVSELTERFVRGDSSRTGEGSGLGLSIAESLCELQNGRFILEIDGDLFKAKVKLPLYNNTFPE